MIATLIGLVVLSGISALALLRARPASAATPVNAELLLVHGFNDTCHDAFIRTQDTGGISPGATPNTTLDFFTNGGWHHDGTHPLAGSIELVGYYGNETGCDRNINGTEDFSGGACNQYLNVANAPSPYAANAKGTASDPIRHLGCLLAWFINYRNTANGVSAVILAHSMGGLIVRDAIGESGRGVPGFPASKLNVTQVVTVGTPHGGLRGFYLQQAQGEFGTNPVPREVWDMDAGAGSGFMPMLFGAPFQRPQGINGTIWYLIAGSSPGAVAGTLVCAASTGTLAHACAIEVAHQNDPYPDGDGVVQADSALSMQADYKALYGAMNHCGVSVTSICDVVYSPGTTLDYSHEANTCFPGTTICLTPEFLLNDATLGAGTTHAWVCPVPASGAGCDSGAGGTDGITDVHVDDPNKPNAQSVPRSLALMLSFLPPPPPPPTATPTPSPCTVTNITTDIERANDFDERGNEWHVYADVQRDATTNAPCKMRVVVRIFNPSPDGAWHGVFALMSYNGSNLVSDSGRHSGSGTYAAHFVWRGPWFNVSSGTYSVKAIEYNGSSYNSLRVRGYIGL